MPRDPLDTQGQKQRERAAKRMREGAENVRDIGKIPPPLKPKRRSRCGKNFRWFCETYYPLTFTMGWSEDHLKVIAQIEESVLRGGLFATAMPRGSGKTSLAEAACQWAILYGHRRFVVLIGSDEDHATQILDSIKTEFEVNDLLLGDFPEVVKPIVELEGIAHRCKGQLCDGVRTMIGWTSNEIILPSIPGSKASGAIIRVRGLTGGIRGMKFKRPDGTAARPDLVLLDDPQTDISARSPSQCESRERILAGAILGLAGPGKKISGIMPCTVIRADDMADRILNRQLHPEWNGTRTKMVYSFPVNEKAWREYAEILGDSLRMGHGGREATEFYAARRETMDEGAVIAWEDRKNPDELSAIQHAMNLKFRDERAFFSEYQNDPMPEQEARGDDLTPDQIMAKINRMERYAIPVQCSRITAFIDVQGTALFYVVCAWEDGFSGQIIDYGAFPDQKMAYFTLRDLKSRLSDLFPSAGLEGQIYGGLDALVNQLMAREWSRDDGVPMKPEKILIDARWGASTDTVKRFCRQSTHAAIVMPSMGKYIGASSIPIDQYRRETGMKLGFNWYIPATQNRGEVRHVTYDSNFWKTFINTRLAVAMGDRGCLTLFGSDPSAHRMLADHLVAEYRIRDQGRGREVDVWKKRIEKHDNHFLDCLAGTAVAASMQGIVLAEGHAQPAKPKKKLWTIAEIKSQGQQFPRQS